MSSMQETIPLHTQEQKRVMVLNQIRVWAMKHSTNSSAVALVSTASATAFGGL